MAAHALECGGNFLHIGLDFMPGYLNQFRGREIETLSVKVSSIRLQGSRTSGLRRDSMSDAYFQVIENNNDGGHNRVCAWNM
jgi:hypothetical protein